MKKLIVGAGIILAAVGGILWFKKASPETPFARDYKAATYVIEGQRSALMGTTQYFGNEAKGDFNADGKQDVAFVLTQTPGGSGTFYYVVAALGSDEGYVGTNAVFLGDRIAPQTTEFRNGDIVVNYADRKAGDPMTAAPSVGVSQRLKIQGNQLVKVAK